MNIFDDFYDLSHDDILAVINKNLSDCRNRADANCEKLETNKRDNHAHAQNRSLSLSIGMICTLADNLGIDTSDDENFKPTDDFYNLTHTNIIAVIHDAYAEWKHNLRDIDTQIQTDTRSIALRNRRNEIDNTFYILNAIIEELNIDIDEYRESIGLE